VPLTPPLAVILDSWTVDPVAIVLAIGAGILYLMGMRAAKRAGTPWSNWRAIAFFGLGLGSFLVVNLGFLGAFSTQLRFAFSTRTALLLFVVPALIALGRPLGLARAALAGVALERLEASMASRPIRVLGNAMVSPIVAVLVFSIFLTPLSGDLRLSVVGQSAITVLIPTLGLLLVLPLIEGTGHSTSFFVTVEFLLAFAELVVDAVPGIVLRLSASIMDGAPALAGIHPLWFPSALRDQQLSGDLLWFIAEIADIPILILLFVRWSRVDRKEARGFDDLSDDEMDALTQEHLKARRQ
jgi:putative membrane protein